MKHFCIGCAWMFMWDVYAFTAENTLAVNVARRMAATVGVVLQKNAFESLDTFIPMTYVVQASLFSFDADSPTIAVLTTQLVIHHQDPHPRSQATESHQQTRRSRTYRGRDRDDSQSAPGVWAAIQSRLDAGDARGAVSPVFGRRDGAFGCG